MVGALPGALLCDSSAEFVVSMRQMTLWLMQAQTIGAADVRKNSRNIKLVSTEGRRGGRDACAPHAQPTPHTRRRGRRTGAGVAWLMGLLLPLMCSTTVQAERREVLRMRGRCCVALADFTPGGLLYQGRQRRLARAALRAVELHRTAILLRLRGGSARAGVSPGEGIAGGEADTHLTREFLAAAEFARKMPGLPAEDKLVFYGLYKQATVGPCNTSKPSCFAWADIAKWQRWQALKVCMSG